MHWAINSSVHHTTHDNTETPDKHNPQTLAITECLRIVGLLVVFAVSCVRSAGDVLEELVDVLGLCSPTGADAHGGVVSIDLLPNGEEVFCAEPVELLVAEDGELLVGGAVDEERYALCL